MTKLEAVIKALDMLGGIAIVDTGGGGYRPEYKNCGTCRYKGTRRTGLCVSPSSVPCDEWSSKA